MRAERDRRAAILNAEGVKQSADPDGRGSQKQAAVLTAEGERQAAILRAEGEAQAIATVFDAIHDGKPDRQLLSYQYLQMLPQLAKGDANKVFVIPSEFSQAVSGIGEAFGKGVAGGRREPCRGRGRARLQSQPMFDSLADKLQATLADVRGHGTLTEADVNAAMREIRLALLEADVNFKVVRTLHRRGQGASARSRRDRTAESRPTGRGDRRRRAHSADGRRSRGAALLASAPDGHPDGGTAGLRQDDRDGQARALPQAGAPIVGRGRGLRRLPAGGCRAADQGWGSGRRRSCTSRGPTATRCEIATWAKERAQAEGKDVLIVDTSGRLHIDEDLMRELAEIRRRDRARRGPARGRRDDGPGRSARRGGVRAGGRLRRGDHDQARRRRPWWRGAVGQSGHRQADSVRVHRGEARRVRALPPGSDGAADSRHGRRDDPDRESSGRL